eukprot:Skav231347  [mRNA]  locus=scaffold1905:49428:50242:- [translate_table: standard]
MQSGDLFIAIGCFARRGRRLLCQNGSGVTYVGNVQHIFPHKCHCGGGPAQRAIQSTLLELSSFHALGLRRQECLLERPFHIILPKAFRFQKLSRKNFLHEVGNIVPKRTMAIEDAH